MRRRTLLCSSLLSATVLSGCLNQRQTTPGTSGTTTAHNETTQTRTEADSKRRAVTLESTDEISQDDTTIQIQVVNAEITEDSPARLRIALRNVGETLSTYTFGSRPPFTPKTHESSAIPSWYLFDADQYVGTSGTATDRQRSTDPTSNESTAESSDDCWWTWEHEVGVFSSLEVRGLEPGQEIAREYVLVANSERDRCHPTGSFRWETTYEYDDQNQDSAEFEWGFSLSVSAVS